MKRIVSLAMTAMLVLSVAGCSQPSASSAPSASSPAASTSSEVTPTQPAVPEEPIVLRILDSSDSTQARRKVFHEEFMLRHPNIKIEYTMMTGDQAAQTVTSAIKAGNAPDLFSLPSGVKLSTAVSEGWYQSMTPHLSKEFLSTFEVGALNEGVTTFNGEIYALPEAANIVNSLMFYNKTILKEAGLDPANPPKTWSEFTEACKKITTAGKGKYYGIIESGANATRSEIELRSFASLAGAKCNYFGVISLVDGNNTFGTPAMKAAVKLYDTLTKDGSIHPNSITLAPPEARAMFAQGQAGFLIQGSWCIPTWRKDNPDLDFGVMALPVPDDGAKGGNPYIGAMPWMGISANSKNAAAAATYLTELYSVEYQSNVVSDGGFVSVIKGVNEKSMTDPTMLEYYQLAKSTGKLCPDPLALNPDTAKVYTEVKEVTPNLGQIFQGVISSSIKDTDAEMDKLSQATQAEWTRAMGAAGVDPSLFSFADWDAMKDYDYSK